MPLSRETRLQIMLTDDELRRIDLWRFDKHMPSRASAIRRLLQIALDGETAANAEPGRKSSDFGVISNRSAPASDAFEEE